MPFPDATTTGWDHSPSYTGSLTAYTGADPLTSAANGTTYTNIDFQGLTVGSSTDMVDSITFQGCRFRSSWNAGWNVQVHGTNVQFKYCTFEPLNSQALPVTFANSYQYGVDIRGASSVTIDHCNIWGFGNAIQIEQSSQALPVVLQNSYIHDAADQDGSGGSGYHHDGFLSNNGGPQYVVISGNTIVSGGNTNAIALQSTGTPYDHIRITGNLLGGFGYTVNIGDGYASGDTSVVFTDNVFTTVSPLPAYGPLKITWPTGNNNIWERNRWRYDGNGDPTADGKYWLPNGGVVSDWNNLTGWVSDTDYGASSAMTEYRIWPSTNGPNTDAADNAAYSMGMAFSVSQNAWVTKIHYYRGNTNVTAATTGGIFDVSTTTLVSGSTVTFSDPGTTTGWITASLSTPLAITSGKTYKVVVQFPNNYSATSNYWSSGAGVGGITNGILTAPDASTAPGGQDTYTASATLAYPNTTFSGGNYWVDVTVTDTDPGAGGGGPAPLIGAVNPLQAVLNAKAGVTGMDAQGAANKWAGTTGLDLVGALNVKAGTRGLGLQGVLNQLAGTTGFGVDEAASRIP